MKTEMVQQIEQIYNSALKLDPSQRQAFLAEACGVDESLRQEIERMLDVQEDAEDFLETSAMEVAVRIAADSMAFERSRALIGKVISHYRILELLGIGGMGIVCKAEDTKLRRQVALKFLSEELAFDLQALKLFRREARTASALNHPQICTIYDIDESKGKAFISMELLEGTTLKERIGSKPLPVSEVLDFGRQIAAGLEAAHSKGIIHRDIKPSNVFVTKLGQIKILDFGLAKLIKRNSETSQDSTQTLSKGAGTPSHMSPEQALRKKLDDKTDIWSLGVTLYEMATGSLPFAGESPAAIFDKILNAEPVAPSELNPELPRKLDRIIAGMLKKNAKDRTPSVKQVAIELACVDRELICLLDVSRPALKDRIHVLNDWAKTHSMEILYVLLPGTRRHELRLLEDVDEKAAEAIEKEDAEWMQKLGIASRNRLAWDEICARVNFKTAYKTIVAAYRDNSSFRDDCWNQTYADLQPRFDELGVQNKWDEKVWVNRWVRYLLEELALKVALFESGEFRGEILPQPEKDVVYRTYEGLYFPCWVSKRGFEVISLSKSSMSHSHYIHENEAGMLGFALQFYFAPKPQ